MLYSHRRQKAIDLLARLDLDALVFCKPENIRYLCGFTGSDGALILFSDHLVFLTDSRYTTQSNEEVTADQVCEYSTKLDGIVTQLSSHEIRKIGFEATLSFGFTSELQTKGRSDWQWQHLSEELHCLRLHKSADEIDLLSQAAELNAEAFASIVEIIKPGVREIDIALALEFALKKRGAEEKAFDLIVASGPRGALPHGIASEKLISAGELVTIDFGCRLSGYHSDETVTLAVGDVSKELQTIFDTVLEAHDRALEAVAPGVALSELDRVARDYIKSRGFGDYFGHGLGHGVGLEVHEAPTVSPRSKATAEAGMVFTVEPGVYVPNVGGVRIEDTVLVTGDGYRTLTKIPKTFSKILLN
jgi:Xaa-Pro aminopeptidase